MVPRRTRAIVILTLVVASGSASFAVASAATQAPKAALSTYFTPLDIQRSRGYRGPVYALAFSGLAVSLIAGAVMGLGRGSRVLGAWAERMAGGWALRTLLLVGVVSVVVAAATLPFDYGRYLHDRHWGLSTQSAAGFLSDTAKGAGFSLAIAAVTALGFVAIARALPRGWPAAAAGFAIVLTVLLVYVLPVVYEPLFNRFTPAPPDVRARVLALAERSGVKVGKVLVADASRRTTTQNAYVSGLGSTKRVVLYDTLLERSTPRQVDLVVAHELGHVAHQDVLKGTVLGSVGGALAVLVIWRLLAWGALRDWIGATGASDPRVIPFLAFAIAAASFLTLPIANTYSRHIEAAADRAALDNTGDPDTAVQVEVSLARSNLSDLQPNAVIRTVFYTHPATLERIQAALNWKAEHAAG